MRDKRATMNCFTDGKIAEINNVKKYHHSSEDIMRLVKFFSVSVSVKANKAKAMTETSS